MMKTLEEKDDEEGRSIVARLDYDELNGPRLALLEAVVRESLRV